MADGKQIRNECVLLRNSVCGVCDDHMTATSAQERLWPQKSEQATEEHVLYMYPSTYLYVCKFTYVCTVYMCMVDLLIVPNNQ